MPKFRKKPVVIEAERFDGVNLPHGTLREPGATETYIDTLEGRMTVSVGDWVIRGVKGEFYPCKPDIFAATYEPADEPLGCSEPECAGPHADIMDCPKHRGEYLSAKLESQLSARGRGRGDEQAMAGE